MFKISPLLSACFLLTASVVTGKSHFPCCSRAIPRLQVYSYFMTLTEKILARAAGKPRVEAGDNIWVNADVLMTHDVCGPGTIGVFKREFGKNAKVWDRN